jgi:probable FeS assembly SUF system protein SufT
MYTRNEPIILKRDVEGTEIPGGNKVQLGAGTSLMLMQALGGSYTMMTDFGYMVRIDGKDVDALGEKYAVVQTQQEAVEGPFEESRVWDQLKTVYDPEIPVNIVDLGLVYQCQPTQLPDGKYRVDIKMTMTAPGCGMGGVLKEDIRHKVLSVPGVEEAEVEVVWDPPWDQSRMSDAARLQLGWM